MGHPHNIAAVLYIYEKVLPSLLAKVPDLKYYIVGSNPPKEIKTLGQDDNIIVTGFVKDIRPYISKASIVLVPERMNSGIKNKILEAMAVGRPIVSTSLGAEGIPSKNGENIVVADDPEDFASGIEKLLKDKELYERIRSAGRKLVEEKYAWVKGVEVLEGILEEMIKTPPK